jgi:hypothetical protein
MALAMLRFTARLSRKNCPRFSKSDPAVKVTGGTFHGWSRIYPRGADAQAAAIDNVTLFSR